jgi:hypothetical protein
MDLDRLEALLAAYGADPARWPAAERDAARALLARSAAARARRDAAARLDRLLDAVPAAAPSPALAARVLAAAPQAPAAAARRRPGRRWPYVAAAASAAAAAALLVVAVHDPGPAPRAVPAEDVARLGVYEVPTDALLAGPEGDLADGVPALGCEESDVGCLDLDLPAGRSSDRGGERVTA